MIDVRVTKITKDKAFLLWEENGEFGNIKIEYDGKGGFHCDAEYIGIERFLKIMRNIPYEFYRISEE